MPFATLPSIEDVLENPSLIYKLPAYYVADLMAQLRGMRKRVEGAINVPPTPVLMALQNPRYQWMDAPHLHYLGDKVADACEQSESVRESALMANMPPRHAKSNTLSVWTPFWYLAKHHERNVLLISHSDNKAREWGVKVRRLIEIYGAAYGLELNPKKMGGGDWELTSGGGMKSVGWEGSISGNPAKLLILDDVVKDDEDARSEVQRQKKWDWWEGTVIQRIEADTTVIVIGTRYHEDDLYGRLLKHSANGDGIPFTLVSLPAKAFSDDPLGRECGEGLWPTHAGWGQSFYDRREAAVSPYVWNSVYQQQPSAPGGEIVDPSWWKYYKPSERPKIFTGGAQSWDLSLDAEKKTDSYHAGLVAGRVDALVYLLDAFHKHCQSTEVVEQVLIWNEAHPYAQTKLVERAIAGPFMAQMLRLVVGGLYLWPPKGKKKGSKQAALEAAVPIIRSGNVLLPMNEDGTKPKWVQEFVEECRAFPRSPHDDYVDCISQMLNFMFPGVFEAKVSIKKAEEAARRAAEVPTLANQHRDKIHATLKRLMQPKVEAMRRAMKRGESVSAVVVPFNKDRGQKVSIGQGKYGQVDGSGSMRMGRATRRMW
jgi:predicted phage terminase large subunit-like protein